MHRPFFFSLLGLILVLGLTTTAMAQPPEALVLSKAGSGDIVDQLLADGWEIVNQGVLQKRHDDGRLETWGYGVEGRQWHVQQLEQELGQMLVDFELAPSAELEKAIAVHRELLGHSREQVELELTRGPERPTTGVRAMEKLGCTVSYSWNASASPNAVASANAAWSHSCGEQASTYAYAYAKKVLSGVTTQKSQTDPSGPGSNISSVASASVSGGANTCYSYARAYVDPPESSFYEITDEDFNCSPLSVSISGATSITLFNGNCQLVAWSATPSGGAGTKSYQWRWNGTNVGSNSTSYSRNVCTGDLGSNTLRVTVSDSTGSASRNHGVSVTYQFIEPPCGSGGQICP